MDTEDARFGPWWEDLPLAPFPQALLDYLLKHPDPPPAVPSLPPITNSRDELLQSPHSEQQKELEEERATKVEQARDILQSLLDNAADGKLVIKNAKAELAKAGLSGRSADRAIAQLGLTLHYMANDKGERTPCNGRKRSVNASAKRLSIEDHY
jgi:hypothetical protein